MEFDLTEDIDIDKSFKIKFEFEQEFADIFTYGHLYLIANNIKYT